MSRDTSFYYSFLVLPPRKRNAIVAVWDFCRAVDDAVDEVVAEDEWAGGLPADARQRASRQICAWRTELEACYTGAATTPEGRALQPAIRAFGLPRRCFDDLIDGVEMDLDHAAYPTFDALSEYCRRVASAVGLICIEIFGYRDAAAREYAIELGMALQLTNIIRDVAADLRRGRIYLPQEDLERFGVTADDLRRGERSPAVLSLLRFECDRARAYYHRAAAALPRADRRRLAAAEIMGAIYFEILQAIERSGYDVFTRRIRVPRPRRAVIALRVFAASLVPAVARR